MVDIVGDSTSESLTGGADSDSIEGLGGDDTLTGNGGSDVLDGGEGNDSLVGEGDDTLIGGLGDDRITTVRGRPVAYGSTGNDIILMDGLFYAGSGTEGRGYGGAGDDYLFFTAPLDGEAYGGSGTDTLGITTSGNFGDAAGGLVDFSSGTGSFTGPGALNLSFSGFERLFFQGNRAANTVVGGGLDDVAYLYDGANQAAMGAGDDTVAARYGAQQSLDGGSGDDLLILQDATFPVYFIVDGLDGSVDDGQLSTITGFERYEILGSARSDIISLGSGNDSATGWHDADTLYGMSGDDFLRGQGGNDSVFGGQGRDRLTGGFGNDVVHGDEGNDIIVLSEGADVGFGGTGNDRLIFGGGGQVGWGDAGRDVFVFLEVDEFYEWIGDFRPGEDRLQVVATELAGAPGPGGPVELSYNTFNGTDPQFMFYLLAGHGYLFWDPDGTGAIDSTLLFVTLNTVTITAADIQFIL